MKKKKSSCVVLSAGHVSQSFRHVSFSLLVTGQYTPLYVARSSFQEIFKSSLVLYRITCFRVSSSATPLGYAIITSFMDRHIGTQVTRYLVTLFPLEVRR